MDIDIFTFSVKETRRAEEEVRSQAKSIERVQGESRNAVSIDIFLLRASIKHKEVSLSQLITSIVLLGENSYLNPMNIK